MMLGMALHAYPARILYVSGLSSLLVLGLCASVAYWLYQEQSRTADILDENQVSTRAALNLEGTLMSLIAVHKKRSADDLAGLHAEVEANLARINSYADKQQERDYADRIGREVGVYFELSRRGKDPAALAENLQDGALATCRQLREFNSREVDESLHQHLRSLRRMTWGMALVGGLGSLAGLVMGFGLARSMRRTIHQFLLRVQGATDLLGQKIEAVGWQRGGEPVDNTPDDLVRRVEQVVSRLQQQEREVRRAERLATVGQLAAGVAHELRNPLTSAILLLETSRKDPTCGGLTDDDLDLIEQELHRIERSLQTFLDFARPPMIDRVDCDAAAVLSDTAALVRGRAEQQHVFVDLKLPAAPCRLLADAGQLRQVMLNLVLNSLDAMPHGGTLSLALQAADDVIEFRVADDGPGIPADILRRLFEPFATGKETGLGLGLLMSKRIVEEHGGMIAGRNRLGAGAEFVVRLPAHVPEPVGAR
jgi:two-component system sensor histidine kinase HydH